MNSIPRMRTLDQCFQEIIKLDPNSAISKYYIRQLALAGKIHCIKSGTKRLIDLDDLIDYIANNNH